MKYVTNIRVYMSEGHEVYIAKTGGAVSIDATGVFSSTLHWLSGPNPWGLHQDCAFSVGMEEIRRGKRITEAAEEAARRGQHYIALHDDDHAALLRVLEAPQPHPNTIPPPANFMRLCFPIFEHLQQATNDPPELPEEVRKQIEDQFAGSAGQA